MSHKDIDKMLLKREMPKASDDLAARIIAAAAVQKDVPFYQIVIQEILAMMILPRPAYALAVFLFIGLIVGLQVQMDTDTATISQELFSFLEVQEEDWL